MQEKLGFYKIRINKLNKNSLNEVGIQLKRSSSYHTTNGKQHIYFQFFLELIIFQHSTMLEAREVLLEIEKQEWKNKDRVDQHAPAPGI